MGPPGAGKGTQAKVLADHLVIPHIASGDLLRHNQEKGTDLGKMARQYMQKGLLVPDDLIIGMIENRIRNGDSKTGYVLDGFPRTLDQARALDLALEKQGHNLDKVLNIQVSEPELVKRLSGRWICRNCQRPYHEFNSPPKANGTCDECGGELYQREDDKPESVVKRIEVYSQQTVPLIEFYSATGKLTEIDGERSIEAVREALLSSIDQ
jgi:adenylate kinase